VKERVGLVFVVATAVSLGISGAAMASSMELVHGTVEAPAGTEASSTVSGTANVFLDTTDRGGPGPTTGHMRALAVGAIRDGRFRLFAEPSGTIRRAARENGGYANFLLMARTTAGESIFAFTRKLGASGAWASSTKPARVPLLAYAVGEARPSATAFASQDFEPADCDWKASKPRYRYTRVGQLHQWSGFRSTFYYATADQADTDFSLAIARGDGNFQAGGWYHVSKTKSHGSIMPAPKGRFSRYMQTRFSYVKIYHKGKDCPARKVTVIRARRHEGGSYYKPFDDAASGPDGRCDKMDSAHRLNVVGGGTEWTEGGEAQKVGIAVRVFGAGIGTQSGWSKNVRSEWRNAGTAMRAICSLYDTPNYAPVTYVGGIVRRN
jgi:hypothetical protein